MDMTLEEQQEWEEQEMANEVEFLKCHIDPAPFQLVEKSSLLKVSNLRGTYSIYSTSSHFFAYNMLRCFQYFDTFILGTFYVFNVRS